MKLTERYLGPRRRSSGYCDRCGMLYTVYWSHRLRKRRDREQAARRAAS